MSESGLGKSAAAIAGLRHLLRPGSGRRSVVWLMTITGVALVLSATNSGAAARPLPMPCFLADDAFLKLPPDKLLGDVSAVSVDSKGDVWVLHRPRTLPEATRAKALPPIIRFRPDGTFTGGFGGADSKYEWPTIEHSLAIAPNGNIWISGAFRADPAMADDMILEFTKDGQFVRQIGRRGGSEGNLDTANVHAPGDLAIDPRANELYVADGYGNRRVIVFDAGSGAYRRFWGAFGSKPTTAPAPVVRAAGAPLSPREDTGPEGFNGVHGVALARDGKVYVSDRNNQRIQAFTRSGRFLRQVFIDRNLRSPMTASGIAFSGDRAQRYMFIADFGNAALVVVDRHRMAVVGRVGSDAGTGPAFTTPHLVASDGKGHLYISEVAARRVRRLSFETNCKAR